MMASRALLGLALAGVLATVTLGAQTGLVMTTGMSRGRAVTGTEPVRLWINIANPSDQDVSNVRLTEMYPASLRLREASWCRARPASVAACGLIAASVPSGSRASVWVDVVALESGEFKPTLELTWADAGAGQSLTFDTLLAQTAAERFFDRGPIWTFLLPIIGGGFALIVRAYYARQEQLSSTWNLMLPESHRNNLSSYVGLTTWSLKVVSDFYAFTALADDATQTVRDARRKSLVFSIVMIHSGMRQRMRSPGGLYLKDRLGEELIVHCESRYGSGSLHKWCEQQGHIADSMHLMSGILDDLDPHASVSSFWIKAGRFASWLPPGQRGSFVDGVATLMEHVDEWVTTTEAANAMQWIAARRELLAFEINRPYETWYGRREWLEPSADVEKLLLEDSDRGLDAAIYLRSAKRGGPASARAKIWRELAQAEREERLSELTRR